MGNTPETRRTDIKSPHLCNSKKLAKGIKPHLPVWYDYLDDRWALVVMYRVHEPITFCPYCGVKLPI